MLVTDHILGMTWGTNEPAAPETRPAMNAPLTTEELRDLGSMVKKGVERWKWIRTDRGRMNSPALWFENGAVVRTEADGEFTPDEITRGIYEALRRRREKARQAAKKAAVTRARRRELKVQKVVQGYLETGKLFPTKKCRVCGRALNDSESIARGVGSECWQDIMAIITAAAARKRGGE